MQLPTHMLVRAAAESDGVTQIVIKPTTAAVVISNDFNSSNGISSPSAHHAITTA